MKCIAKIVSVLALLSALTVSRGQPQPPIVPTTPRTTSDSPEVIQALKDLGAVLDEKGALEFGRAMFGPAYPSKPAGST